MTIHIDESTTIDELRQAAVLLCSALTDVILTYKIESLEELLCSLASKLDTPFEFRLFENPDTEPTIVVHPSMRNRVHRSHRRIRRDEYP